VHNQEQINNLINGIIKKEINLSYSALSAFRKSPQEFINYKFRTFESTPAMEFGSLVHCMVLEPEKLEKRYVRVPNDAPKRPTSVQLNAKKPSEETLKAIEFWNQFNSENENKTIISKSDFYDAMEVANNIRKYYPSSNILSLCSEFEKKVEFEYNNFKFKGFIDGEGINVRTDLKIVQSAEPRKFQRDSFANGHHIQAGIYQIANGRKPYYIISADRNNGLSVHKLSQDLIDYGIKEVNKMLEDFNRAILEDSWNKSYDFYSDRMDGAFEFELPKYLTNNF
jgi:hypothetical protein